MADIAKVKAFAYKGPFRKQEVVFRSSGEKTWTAPVYSYIFTGDNGSQWELTQSSLDRYIEDRYIRVTETAQ